MTLTFRDLMAWQHNGRPGTVALRPRRKSVAFLVEVEMIAGLGYRRFRCDLFYENSPRRNTKA
jgi:hypothetical protein